MRIALLVLLAAAAILASPTAVPPTVPTADPVERALQALHGEPAQPEILEAVVAAGLDPTDWHGRDLLHEIGVPAPSGDPIEPLRELYAVLSAGAEATAWHDPARGRVDLLAQLAANAPAALASADDAAQSFQLLAMAAAGSGEGAADASGTNVSIGMLRERLLALQHDSGAWGCGPWPGPECTAFALAALRATETVQADGATPAEPVRRAADYLASLFGNGTFSDPLAGPSVQAAAWGIQGLRLAGEPVPAGALDWVLDQQRPDGMWSVGGRPSAWATAEVVVMLAGGHPI